MKVFNVFLVVFLVLLVGLVFFLLFNQKSTERELSDFKSSYKEEIKKEMEENCRREGTYGLGKSESWIDEDLIGTEDLDTCKEICNRLDEICQSGSIEEYIETDGRWSGTTVIACNTPFGIDKTSQGAVSCICCYP